MVQANKNNTKRLVLKHNMVLSMPTKTIQKRLVLKHRFGFNDGGKVIVHASCQNSGSATLRVGFGQVVRKVDSAI